MKRIILLLSISAAFGCNSTGSSATRKLKHEKGFVVAMQYAAPIEGRMSTTTYNSDGSIGFGSSRIHDEEKYMVVFRCEHGVVFSVDQKDLYTKLNEKDSVIIDYFETSDSVKVYDLDFKDANPIKK